VLMEYNVASSDGGAVSARQSVALFRHSKFIDNVSPLGSAVLVYEVCDEF
jgi:predicted outer membrane repeat protein